MPIPTITALPTPPSRTTQSAPAFNTSVDQWLDAQADMVDELNAFGDAVDAAGTAIDADVATVAADKATVAADKATVAADKATVALDKAAAAASALAASDSEDAAAASAVAAAASAATAASVIGTSTTSLAIATGSKTFTTQAGKNWTVGSYVIAASAADPANYMFGQVTSYSSTTLIVDVQAIGGSGTKTDWNISLAGARGATGATGGSPAYSTIASSTATGGSTIDFTSIPTTYQDLLLDLKEISTTTSANIEVLVSNDNGVSWSTNGIRFMTSAGSGAFYTGMVRIFDYRAGAGGAEAKAANLGSGSSLTAGAPAATDLGGSWIAAGGINAIRLKTSAGTFDGMNATLKGI